MINNVHELEKFSPNAFFYATGDQLRDHITERMTAAFERGRSDKEWITTRDALEERNKEMRSAMLSGLGGLPGTNAPLNAVVTGVETFDGFRVEKIIYESRPYVYVTCAFGTGSAAERNAGRGAQGRRH